MSGPIPLRGALLVAGRYRCPDCPYASNDPEAAFVHLMSDCPVKRAAVAEVPAVKPRELSGSRAWNEWDD